MVPGGRTDRVDRGRAGPTRGEHLDAALPPRVPSGQMGPRSASLSPFFWGGGFLSISRRPTSSWPSRLIHVSTDAAHVATCGADGDAGVRDGQGELLRRRPAVEGVGAPVPAARRRAGRPEPERRRSGSSSR